MFCYLPKVFSRSFVAEIFYFPLTTTTKSEATRSLHIQFKALYTGFETLVNFTVVFSHIYRTEASTAELLVAGNGTNVSIRDNLLVIQWDKAFQCWP
jgi:hypothetical protein